MKTIWTCIGSVILLFLPLFSIHEYSTFRYLGGYGMAPAIYAGSYALAATLFEFQWKQKLIRFGIVAVGGMIFGATFDGILILSTVIAVGAIAVGVSDVFGGSFWKTVLYRFVRTGIALGLTIVTFFLHLPTSGKCPGSGGDITGVFSTFAIMTYIPLCGLLLVDLGTRYIFGWKPRPQRSRDI